MDKKFYTFLIFPGAHGKLHKIRLPFYVVHMVSGVQRGGNHDDRRAGQQLCPDVAEGFELQQSSDGARGPEDAEPKPGKRRDHDQRKVGLIAILGLGSCFDVRFWRSPTPAFSRSGAVARDANQFHPRVQLPSFPLRFQFDPEFFPRSFPPDPAPWDLFPRADFGRETVPSIWPVRGRVTEGFGQRLDPFSGEGVFHSGVDISPPSAPELRPAVMASSCRRVGIPATATRSWWITDMG